MDIADKIAALKELLSKVGRLWPSSTKLAGYAEDGPYHCKDCIYLKGRTEGKDKIFKDDKGKGRCNNAFMLADMEVKHDKDGLAIVNIKRGCCEFVDNVESFDEIQES